MRRRTGHSTWAMRLVVCIDRDDDLGRKASVSGPVVGRASVLEAAVKLGTVDPEDSDTNALFAAVSLLDELRGAGEECEVCILTGSRQGRRLSDRRVADQFDDVSGGARARSRAYLVSDGAEDEYLFPILASRVKVDGVRRVYVRQSASIESTYYTRRPGAQRPETSGEDRPPVRARPAHPRGRGGERGHPLGRHRPRDRPRGLSDLLDVRHRRGDHRFGPRGVDRHPPGVGGVRLRAFLDRARRGRLSFRVQ